MAHEVAGIFDARFLTIYRCYEEEILVLATVGVPAAGHPFSVGTRWPLDAPSLTASVYRTGRPLRIDDYTDATGVYARAREAGVKSPLGGPIVVDGNIWGSINVASPPVSVPV